MSRSLTGLEVCERALMLLGERGFQGFDDTSTPALACRAIYPSVRLDALARFPWTFAKTEFQCAEDEVRASVRWPQSFAVPVECLRVHDVFDMTGDNVSPYEIMGRRVLCNSLSVVVLGSHDVTEAIWSPSFVTAVVNLLAANLAVPITDDPARQGPLLQESERLFQVARMSDASQQPPRRLDYSNIAHELRRG